MGAKSVARDILRFWRDRWIASPRWFFTAIWWLWCEQYGVVWCMMVASLKGSVWDVGVEVVVNGC